jgi:hypothetical protein
MKPRLWALVVVVALGGDSLAEARTWTDTQGRTLEAKFVRLHEGNVILLKGNKPVSVPLSQFSPEDQEYIRQQTAKKPRNDAVEPLEKKPARREVKSADDAQVRTWTDIRGNQITARFAGLSGANVILVEKGKRRSFPFVGFSQADQQYIRNELEAKGQGHLLPAAGMPGQPSFPIAPPRAGPSPPTPPTPTPHRRSPPSRPSFRVPEPAVPTIPRPGPSPSIRHPSPPRYQPRRPSTPRFQPPAPSIPSHRPAISPPTMPSMPTPRTTYQYEKRCTNCGKVVPSSSKAGGTCPHCGAYWSVEKDESGRTVSTAYRAGQYTGIAVVVGLVIWLLSRAAGAFRD